MSWSKRGPSTYRFSTDLPPDPDTGRRVQVTKTFRGSAADMKVAHAAWLIEVKGSAAASLTGTSTTFAELSARFLATIDGHHERNTYESYERNLRLYLVPALGSIPLKDLRASHLDDLYRTFSRSGGTRVSGLAPRSVRSVHGTAQAALQQAVKWEWLSRNPAATASPPPIYKSEPVSPPAGELDRLIAHLRLVDAPLALFMELLEMTGARPGEMCAVRWQDVDLQTGRLTISGSIQRGQMRTRKATKTHKVRHLALDSDTVTALKKWHVECGEPASACYLFSDERTFTTPWRPDSAGSKMRWHRMKQGVDRSVTFRGERHFHATHLIANGVDVVTVAKRLGHSNPAMTLNVYSSAVPENDEAAAELLRAIKEKRQKDE